jgi:hypothetical protein
MPFLSRGVVRGLLTAFTAKMTKCAGSLVGRDTVEDLYKRREFRVSDLVPCRWRTFRPGKLCDSDV